MMGHAFVQICAPVVDKIGDGEHLHTLKISQAKSRKLFPLEIILSGRHGSLTLCFLTRDQRYVWLQAL